MLEKLDNWVQRSQIGLTIISMSVTKTISTKLINTTNCREAYLLLQTTYGGALTVAEMAHIGNLFDTKITKKEAAESYIGNWKSLLFQSGVSRNAENDANQQNYSKKIICINLQLKWHI